MNLLLIAVAVAGLVGAFRYRGRRIGSIVAVAAGAQVLVAATVGLWVAFDAVTAVSSSSMLTVHPAIEVGYFTTVAGAGMFLLGGSIQLALDDVLSGPEGSAATTRRSSTRDQW